MEQEQLRQQAETARSEREMQARIAMNTADNNTAMQLALLDLANGNASSDAPQNPNPNPTP
jgi:thioredoxin-like negative regulator of GroEL